MKNTGHEEKVFLDLEMNPVSKEFREERQICKSEIIEVGAVKYDADNRKIGTFREYVRPKYSEKLTGTVEKLTHLDPAKVYAGDSFSAVIARFLEWCGDRCVVFCWSENDYIQLMEEGLLKSFEAMERLSSVLSGWRDVQTEFADASGISRHMNLGKAMDLCDIRFPGMEHNALDDAAATAELFFEMNGGTKVRKIRNAMGGNDEPIGMSLGSLLANFCAVA